MLAVYVNQPPVGGSCTVSPPDGLSLTSLTSMLDGVTVACSGWTDPESQGITSYAINSEINFYLDCLAKNVDIGKIQKSLLSFKNLCQHGPREIFSLSYFIFEFYCLLGRNVQQSRFFCRAVLECKVNERPHQVYLQRSAYCSSVEDNTDMVSA